MSEEKAIHIEDEVVDEELKEEKQEASEECSGCEKEAACEEDKTCEETKEATGTEEAESGSQEEPKDEPKAEPEKEDKKYDELNARYMRLMADFQNQKKRFEKERADIYQFANEDIVKSLLEVLDNFERALEASKDADPKFLEGMQMIFKQLLGALEKAGVSEIKALGEEFDPNFHNAVMMEETSEYESNKVSGVLQKGYTLNSKVIRPSMVKVAQ